MGPDSNSGPVVVYLDGQPVEIGHPLPEITPDYSAGGATAEEAAAAAEIWGDMSVTVEVAAEGLRAFFYSLELAMAVHLARIFKPELANRYRRTKKKRIRKKYEKRIMAWFGEVWGKCSD